jgi:predicted phosphodiesterase
VALDRREFLKALGSAAGLILLPGCSWVDAGESLPPLSTKTRTVWAWSDSHIGRIADKKDGAQWAEMAVDDLIKNMPKPDYALVLGDITHHAKPESLKTYARLRRKAGITRWYEMAGNHDYKGIESGDFGKIVRKEEQYVLQDGNLVWIFIPAERGRSAGMLHEPTRKWLPKQLAKHQDKNVIVCSHQMVANTLRYSDPKHDTEGVLNPGDWIAKLLKKYRVDVWFCGHEHGPKRDKGQVRRIGRTTFINVASLSHLYGTQASNSFLLEMTAGKKEIVAKLRHHDRAQYVERLSVRLPLPLPIRFDAEPKIISVMTPPYRAPKRGQ